MERYTQRKALSEIVIFPDALIPITVTHSDEIFQFQNARMFPALERLCALEEATETAEMMSETMGQYLHRMQNMLAEIAKDNLNKYLNQNNVIPARKLKYNDYMHLADMFVATHKGSILKEKSWSVTIKKFLKEISTEVSKQNQHK